MKKSDPIEQALDRLGGLRREGEKSAVTELKGFLKNRSNIVVAKAAKVAAQLRVSEVIPELITAFDRLMANPTKLDKGCAAVIEIATALYELDYVEPEIYLRGLRHVQMEASFGPPIDVAAKLRGISACGLVRTSNSNALGEIVALLVDDWTEARIGAVRALASNGGDAGSLLLKLKVLTGDIQPDVIAECFSGLLATDRSRSLPFVAGYIDSADPTVADAALLAIGASRMPEAFALLKAKSSAIAAPRRNMIFMAIAMLRSQESIEFLLSLLPHSNVHAAAQLLPALALFQENESVRREVEAALSRHDNERLNEVFRQEFSRP